MRGIQIIFLFILALTFFLLSGQDHVDVSAVIKKLSSNLDEERYAAINYLGMIKCREAAPPLHEILPKAEYLEKEMIMAALFRINSPDSLLPILKAKFSDGYFYIGFAGKFESILNAIDNKWRSRPEVAHYIDDILEEYSARQERTHSDEENTLNIVAFLSNKKNWRINVKVMDQATSKEKSQLDFYLLFELTRPLDRKSGLTLPFYFSDRYFILSYMECFDRLQKHWRKQPSMRLLARSLRPHINRLIDRINRELDEKRRFDLMENEFREVVLAMYEITPGSAFTVYRDIINDQRNVLSLRLFCLEWEYACSPKGLDYFSEFDRFIKNYFHRFSANDYQYLSRAIRVFMDKKDRRIIPFLLDCLAKYTNNCNKQEMDFYDSCLWYLYGIDEKKAAVWALDHLSRLSLQDAKTSFDNACIRLVKKVKGEGEAAKPLNEKGKIETMDNLQKLCQKLLDEETPKEIEERRSVMSQIIAMNDPKSAEFVCDWLGHFHARLETPAPDLRGLAEEELEKRKMDMDHARKQAEYLKQLMIKALADWKHKKAIPLIKPYLRDDSPGVRAYAEWAIYQITH